LNIISPENEFQIDGAKKLLLKNFKHIGLKDKDLAVYFEQPVIYSSFIALENNKVVGTAIVNKQTGYFSWLAVDEKLRRKGTGSALCKIVEATLRKKKFKRISLDTRNQFKSALLMYLQNGYEIRGTFLHNDDDLMIRLSKKI
jgi:ribosomal protein S18 acetylase RimI-like enzyme